jgi:Glutathione-dependent formaldehyde-activating enzyme
VDIRQTGRQSSRRESACSLTDPGSRHRPMTHRIASCSCGQLQAHVASDPIRVSVCHCLACQRRTGSVFGAQARFASTAVTIEGTSKEFVRVGDDPAARPIYLRCVEVPAAAQACHSAGGQAVQRFEPGRPAPIMQCPPHAMIKTPVVLS